METAHATRLELQEQEMLTCNTKEKSHIETVVKLDMSDVRSECFT